MKKIPTLFERIYENHKIVDVLPKVTNGEPQCKIKCSDFGFSWNMKR